jgi:hypothetical protein
MAERLKVIRVFSSGQLLASSICLTRQDEILVEFAFCGSSLDQIFTTQPRSMSDVGDFAN